MFKNWKTVADNKLWVCVNLKSEDLSHVCCEYCLIPPMEYQIRNNWFKLFTFFDFSKDNGFKN